MKMSLDARGIPLKSRPAHLPHGVIGARGERVKTACTAHVHAHATAATTVTIVWVLAVSSSRATTDNGVISLRGRHVITTINAYATAHAPTPPHPMAGKTASATISKSKRAEMEGGLDSLCGVPVTRMVNAFRCAPVLPPRPATAVGNASAVPSACRHASTEDGATTLNGVSAMLSAIRETGPDRARALFLTTVVPGASITTVRRYPGEASCTQCNTVLMAASPNGESGPLVDLITHASGTDSVMPPRPAMEARTVRPPTLSWKRASMVATLRGPSGLRAI